MNLSYADIIPRLIQAEAQFSTLSLTGTIPGPRYEDFDSLVKRANHWFRQNRECRPVSCEVLEVDGAYTINQHDGSVPADDDSPADWEPQVPAFLRVLRIWYRKETPNDDSEPLPCQLDYMNVLPARLESTPRAFGPKFLSLTDTIKNLNTSLLKDPDCIPGHIVSIQTCICRFSSKHCSVDPDRTFWMAENPEDMHICYYFRIFFVRSGHRPARYQLGMKDFAPQYSWKGKRKRDVCSDTFSSLSMRANQWLQTTSGIEVITCQTLDHHSYFRCLRDTPGHEILALDNPHFRSSLSGLMHYTKVLRIFFMQHLDDDRQNSVMTPSVDRKSFHVPACTCSSHVRLASKSTNSHLPLEHRQLLHRINGWLSHIGSGPKLLSIETVKVTTSELKSTFTIEDTHFQSCGKGDMYSLYGIRLFMSHTVDRTDIDMSPDPKYIRVSDANCDIL